MVHLTKIYTKTGDEGLTHLMWEGKSRTAKNDKLIEAIGAVDEANSAIGMIEEDYDFNQIQNDLFDLGAVLAGASTVQITDNRITYLENKIDELNKDLPELTSFILPKGDIHNARAIVRRAERRVWDAIFDNHIDNNVAKYLNRLSDYLFVLARYDSMTNQETLWKPMGKNEK